MQLIIDKDIRDSSILLGDGDDQLRLFRPTDSTGSYFPTQYPAASSNAFIDILYLMSPVVSSIISASSKLAVNAGEIAFITW